jgi:phosphoribosylformimino-5-aminoimidazole carboxamide ribotide isomerase
MLPFEHDSGTNLRRRAMLIVPVLDLAAGVVVRGIAGRRHEYRPIESRLAGDPSPSSIGRALADFGLSQVYVADLDAIARAEPAWQIYEQLAGLGLQLWIDAGVGDARRAAELCQFADRVPAVTGIIVGLESLADSAALAETFRVVPRRLLIFSLDLIAGQPLAAQGWPASEAETIARVAIAAGARRLIVLDLARVGGGGGVGTLDLCRRLLLERPELQIIAGGGVRGPADLEELAAAGCLGALVASALHDGGLTPADCRRLSGHQPAK